VTATSSWNACRINSTSTACCKAMVPGTALHTLLYNGTFGSMRDPYIDTRLRDSVPDINKTGSAWWTFAYSTSVLTADIVGCFLPQDATAQAYVSLDQGSYRIKLYLDGELIRPVSGNTTDAKGMFRRFDWALGPATPFCAATSHSLRFDVAPPDHPGSVTGGQGGDHLLSQDLISQDLAGWDWVAGVPDRECSYPRWWWWLVS
jgi:hypothetical protein